MCAAAVAGWLAGWLGKVCPVDKGFCFRAGLRRIGHSQGQTLQGHSGNCAFRHNWKSHVANEQTDVGPIAAFRSCHRFPQGVLHPGGLGILSNLLMAMYFYTSIEAGNRHHVSRGGGCRSFQVLEVFFLWVSSLQGRVCTCGACASLPRCLVVCCRSRRLCSCRRRPRCSRRSELPS